MIARPGGGRRCCGVGRQRIAATGVLLLGSVLASPSPAQTVFLENWDSVGEGGDGVNSFTSGPLYPLNDAATVDGSRCQYHNPGAPVFHPRSVTACRPWNGSNWHVHLPGNSPAAKSFSGDGALHMGTHRPGADSSYDSYTIAQLSQAVSPTISLPAGGGILSFRHILAVTEGNTFQGPAYEMIDRAVVQVARVDPQGVPMEPWTMVPPYQNGYTHDARGPFGSNCMFDPTDDGSTEDNLYSSYDPSQPVSWTNLPLGPSSTCAPRLVLPVSGDWTSTNPADVGWAAGPGELGNLGNGVWVESRIDMTPYAGSDVRIRLLFTGLEATNTGARWDQIFGNSLGNAQRGWILDDFRVPTLAGSEGSVSGVVYSDSRLINGNMDLAEPMLGSRTVRLFDSAATLLRSTHSDSAGGYGFVDLPPGSYTVGIATEPGETWTPDSQPVTIAANQGISGLNFGRGPLHDLRVALYEDYPTDLSRPCGGDQMTYCVAYENTGSFAESGSSVRLQLPPAAAVTYISTSTEDGCSAPPTTLGPPDAANLMTWDIPAPFESGSGCTVCATVQVVAPQGTALAATADVYLDFPAQDLIPTTANTASSQRTVDCALDANDMRVEPGCGPGSYVNDGQLLTSRIGFRNSGEVPVTRVVISIVLDPGLDLPTLEVVETSHAVTSFDVYPDRRAVWVFEDLQLPPASTDPDGSEGFVLFRIRPLPALTEGTVIRNVATVGLDDEEPVLTHSAVTTITGRALPSNLVPGPEICAPNTDNNCDGVALGDACDGVGTCGAGFLECDGTGGARCSTDSGGSQSEAQPEVCDRLDNDCDGVLPPEEADLDGDSQMACGGDCDDTNAAVGPNFQEVCDRLDNNCDGVTPTIEIDQDGDDRTPCEGDCNDANATAWGIPSEVPFLELDGPTVLRWTPPADLGGTQSLYDVIRSSVPDEWYTGADCVASDHPALETDDIEVPTSGQMFFYVVQATNGCPATGFAGPRFPNGNWIAVRECP